MDAGGSDLQSDPRCRFAAGDGEDAASFGDAKAFVLFQVVLLPFSIVDFCPKSTYGTFHWILWVQDLLNVIVDFAFFLSKVFERERVFEFLQEFSLDISLQSILFAYLPHLSPM